MNEQVIPAFGELILGAGVGPTALREASRFCLVSLLRQPEAAEKQNCTVGSLYRPSLGQVVLPSAGSLGEKAGSCPRNSLRASNLQISTAQEKGYKRHICAIL